MSRKRDWVLGENSSHLLVPSPYSPFGYSTLSRPQGASTPLSHLAPSPTLREALRVLCEKPRCARLHGGNALWSALTHRCASTGTLREAALTGVYATLPSAPSQDGKWSHQDGIRPERFGRFDLYFGWSNPVRVSWVYERRISALKVRRVSIKTNGKTKAML
ncbi:hypothetical protein [Fischerella sp. PCC 9605]|uniref:hypothetical protein n=1 Tax=Fischerella sp. PCC 9605 TaxID=1173024 RepID=UPI0012DC3674|nr:hypothetical protein [Fischerella sp. PCC 9605]